MGPESLQSTTPELLLSPAFEHEQWYATYTFPRHENKVHQQLVQRGVPCYLPMYSEVHRWKDRRVTIQLPLFPGYLFVRISATQKTQVLGLNSVIRIVGFQGRPAPLPAEEIEALKLSLQHRKVHPHPFLTKGKRVRLKNGPLKGLEGIIMRNKGELRLVVSISCIMNSAAVDLEASDVELIS